MNTQAWQGFAQLNKTLHRFATVSFIFLITFGSQSFADDTEIFLKIADEIERKPNVLIMLDSSSSMNQAIKYVNGYDPDAPLPDGLVGKCREDLIFVETKATPGTPECNNSGTSNTTPHINPSALKCRDIAEFMLNVGSISARVSQLTFPTTGPNKDKAVWGLFNKTNALNKPIDCLDDEGIHGDVSILKVEDGKVVLDEDAYATENTTENYILDGSVSGWSETEEPYVTNADGLLVNPHWSPDNFVTLYTGHFLNYVDYVITNDIKDENGDSLYVQTDGTTLAKTAMTEIVKNFRGFNLGLARYDIKGNQKTAFILAPTVSLDDDDLRGDLQRFYIDPLGIKAGDPIPPSNYTSTQNNTFTGGQPMSAGQYEAYTYFKGLHAFGGGPSSDSDGKYSSPQPPSSTATTGAVTPTVNNVPSAIDASGDYISPITEDSICTGNYVLYLTAGGASSDAATDPEINAATLWNENGTTSGTLSAWNGGDCGISNDYCLDELSKFMYEHDFAPDVANGSDGEGGVIIQNVTTYGISINNSAPDLDEAATVGGGYFRKAENPGAISAILQDIISDIIGDNTTFIAPSISVNNFNRLQNLDDLYFSLFTPTDTRVWTGNLKKYKLIFGKIKDALDSFAVDPDTGAFKVNSLSYWTDPTDSALADAPVKFRDGNETGLGGFASRMLTNRNVYTNLSAGTGNVNLTLNSTALNETNASITKTLLGIDTETDEYRTALLAWGAGYIYDEDDSTKKISTKFVGDLLHTTPLVLTYGTAAANVAQLDQSIFFGTNNGYLHAVQANPSASPASMEHFAFAPYETLSKLDTFYKNEKSITQKLYGLDGPITAWIDETTTKNKIVDSGEDVYLYVTQRRGGQNIYALNVENRASPELVWKIRGNDPDRELGEPGPDPGFEDLGQTWSAVQHATIKNANDSDNGLEVVFFSGGYDTNQDTGISSSAPPATDGARVGNAIYMVDAKTGELMWSAIHTDAPAPPSPIPHLKLSDMTYAIPSDLKVLDVNVDGYADRIYVGDLGGQVWRFDIGTPYVEASTADFEITGGVIAKLSYASESDAMTPKPLTNRRFFSAPTVALVSNNSYGTYLSIALGSGYRSHPLDEVLNDKFYMIKDYNVNGPVLDSDSGAPVYDPDAIIYDDSIPASATSQLIDITSNAQPEFSTIVNRSGWVINLTTSGEKVINPAITADNKIYFTTYIPENEEVSEFSCVPNSQLGKSRLYTVSLLNGGVTGEIQYDDNGDPIKQNPDERFEELTAPGISPPPELLSGPDDPLNPTLPASCSSTTKVTLIVGTQTFDPDICTAPVKTYWNRVD